MVFESTVSIYTQGNSGTSLSPDDVLAYADAQPTVPNRSKKPSHYYSPCTTCITCINIVEHNQPGAVTRNIWGRGIEESPTTPRDSIHYRFQHGGKGLRDLQPGSISNTNALQSTAQQPPTKCTRLIKSHRFINYVKHPPRTSSPLSSPTS